MSSPIARIRQVLTIAATLLGVVAQIISALRPRSGDALDAGDPGDAADERTCAEGAAAPE